MKSLGRITTLLVIFLFCFACSQKKETILEPSSLKGKIDERTASVSGNVYKYAVTQYDKPVIAREINRSLAAYNSPEDAVVSHLSAMKAQDYDWYRHSWDKTSLAKMDARNKSQNITPEILKDKWKAVVGISFELTHRIEYTLNGKAYTFIAYQESAEPSKRFYKLHCIPLIKYNDRWFLTQDLDADKGYHLIDELIQSGKSSISQKSP
jgi:hypothetical protein